MTNPIRSILLLAALSLSVIPPVFAEVKAEPLSVQLKNNKAAFKGTLSGDEQYEYALAAKKGQWLMVEVVSTPADAAFFSIKTPDGKEIQPQHAWSGAISQSGQYEIDVSKFADYQRTNFTLAISLSARPFAPQPVGKDVASLSLQATMRKFIMAFRQKNGAAFLSLFSRSRPSYHLNPMNIGSKSQFRTAVSYAEMAADIKGKKGWYESYLDGGDLDDFADNIPDNRMWKKAKANTFVLPGDSITSRTFVKWRREGARWVIDEISYPSA